MTVEAVLSANERYFLSAVGEAPVTASAFQGLLLQSPAAQSLGLTDRLVAEFLGKWLVTNPGSVPSPAPAAAKAGGAPISGSKKVSLLSPKTLIRSRPSGASRSSGSSSPSPERQTGQRFSCDQFLVATKDLQAFVAATMAGTVIIGNGRSVLGLGAGPVIDGFAKVVRFNDYQIAGYEADIGSKTDLWVVSDWTCVKLLSKYPERKVPVLIAIPYKFMGKPYYRERRAELEQELRPEVLARCTFVPEETVRQLIEENRFGDRWPSSGLICIIHMLSTREHMSSDVPLGKLHLHGFDFFKEIGAHNPWWLHC